MEDEIKTQASFLEQVRIEREALEKANSEMKELIKQQQELRAVEILSGKTEAGKQVIEKKETPKEYAERMLRGG